jgi:hypothetical protein
MSTHKTKKKQSTPPTKDGYTKSYYDEFSNTARKILKHAGLDPSLYDKLTKRQRLKMTQTRIMPWKVGVKAGHDVPRHYVKFIHKKLYQFLKEEMIGDPELHLSYSEFATMGIAFISYITSGTNSETSSPDDIRSIISEGVKPLVNSDENDLQLFILNYIGMTLCEISKINFRIYSSEFNWEQVPHSFNVVGKVNLTSTPAEKVHFTYKEKSRPAYRMAVSSMCSAEPMWFTKPLNSIIKHSKSNRPIKIYVQNHTLSRMKERLDTLDPHIRNGLLSMSLANCKMEKNDSGRLFIKCADLQERVLGYFPFTIIDDNLYVLSFLPLTSIETPEGKRLREILNTEKIDIRYLGMDKLSFFQQTEFESVPKLKMALQESKIWHLTEVEADEEVVAMGPSTTLSHFFKEMEPEYQRSEILESIVDID